MSKVEVIEGFRMVGIPSGSFVMGHEYRFDPNQPENVNQYYPDEQPSHKVTVKAFQLGEMTVTQKQFDSLIGAEQDRSTFKGEDFPVTNIGPVEIRQLCNKLSKIAGFDPCYAKSSNNRVHKCDFSKNGFRLPTEAEWEYACRAGTTTHFNTGNTEKDLDKAGWYRGNSGGKVHPVGQKEPNKWGLYDMHGNVFEFCDDDWNPNMSYGRYLTSRDTELVFNYYHQMLVTRGGSWFNEPSVCRSAARSCFCSWPKMNGWYNGFRMARNIA